MIDDFLGAEASDGFNENLKVYRAIPTDNEGRRIDRLEFWSEDGDTAEAYVHHTYPTCRFLR